MTRLEGLRVLDLTRLLPGGYATLLLADLGADVIKVEEPGKGDYIRWMPPIVGGFSSGHIALNRNKRSVTLNLKEEVARAVFRTLVRTADVVIESFRPGVMDRLGLGWEQLKGVNPKLVYCAITGYGQDGPRAAAAGHDANYTGYAGHLSITGPEGGRPVLPGLQIGDLGGGGMAAVISILTALLGRERSGRGGFCDVSMTDGAFSWLSVHAASYVATKEVPGPGAMHLTGAFPCYRIYPASDGWLTVGALEPQFWRALCDAIERPDLIDDAFAHGARRDEVIAELEGVFAQRTRAEWSAHFGDADVCVGPVNDLAEAFDDPQLRSRGMVAAAPVPGVGTWNHVGNPVRIDGEVSPVDRLPPPGLGEHTEEVLAEAGVDPDEIQKLRDAGAT